MSLALAVRSFAGEGRNDGWIGMALGVLMLVLTGLSLRRYRADRLHGRRGQGA